MHIFVWPQLLYWSSLICMLCCTVLDFWMNVYTRYHKPIHWGVLKPHVFPHLATICSKKQFEVAMRCLFAPGSHKPESLSFTALLLNHDVVVRESLAAPGVYPLRWEIKVPLSSHSFHKQSVRRKTSKSHGMNITLMSLCLVDEWTPRSKTRFISFPIWGWIHRWYSDADVPPYWTSSIWEYF